MKILTEQKLRLDEGYLQINNKNIKLKPAHKLNHNLNVVTENPQETTREFKSRVAMEQKEFLKKMLEMSDKVIYIKRHLQGECTPTGKRIFAGIGESISGT